MRVMKVNRKNLLAVGMSMLCLFGASTMQVAASETNLIPIQGQTTEASQVETINEETDSMLSGPKDTEIDESIDDGIIEPAPDLPESEPSEEETPPADVPTIPDEENKPTEDIPLPDDEQEENTENDPSSEESVTPPINESTDAPTSSGNVATSVINENPTISGSYAGNAWYRPSTVQDLGCVGETKNSIKLDNYMTRNYSSFILPNNPFSIGQCTWLAWSRFYQVYGFDSGARGNGKTNAAEIVKAHPDLFQLSSTPSAGSVFSIEKNTLYPEYGHVGFVEAFDGNYLWISEGNVFGGLDFTGSIWIHKVSWIEFKAQYPDVVFAVPKEAQKEEKTDIINQLLSCKKTVLRQCILLTDLSLPLKF